MLSLNIVEGNLDSLNSQEIALYFNHQISFYSNIILMILDFYNRKLFDYDDTYFCLRILSSKIFNRLAKS